VRRNLLRNLPDDLLRLRRHSTFVAKEAGSMKHWQDEVALITGASSGISLATVLAFVTRQALAVEGGWVAQ
jgi:3-oxoacyl-ACP reductase-like protein